MIPRELFVNTLNSIKKEFKSREQAGKELRKLGLSIDAESTPFLDSLVEVLKETVPDPYDYISWWLYDASDYLVSWEKDGKTIEKNLEDANDLYDFLMDSAANEVNVETLLSDIPARENDPIPNKRMEQTDFTRYMDAVLRYIETHDVVIQIFQEEQGKYVLMSAKVYDRLFGALELDGPVDEDGMVTIEITVDAELERRARQALEGTGFTLEQVTEMFLCWCALYPKDATAWIENAKKEIEAGQNKSQAPEHEGQKE